MKKKFLIILMLIVFFVTGCGKSGKNDIVDKINKKVKAMDSYQITGILSITNNEDTYNYDVKASYKAKDNYRVSLVNKSNNHEQIILKNDDGVYVLTHKSTK